MQRTQNGQEATFPQCITNKKERPILAAITLLLHSHKLRSKQQGHGFWKKKNALHLSFSNFFCSFEHHKQSAIWFSYIREKANTSTAPKPQQLMPEIIRSTLRILDYGTNCPFNEQMICYKCSQKLNILLTFYIHGSQLFFGLRGPESKQRVQSFHPSYRISSSLYTHAKCCSKKTSTCTQSADSVWDCRMRVT